jgi:hypothetical protein
MSYLHCHRRRGETLGSPHFDERNKVEEDRKAQITFVLQRFRVDPENAEQLRTAADAFQEMSVATRTLLAMEMAERERASYTAEYNPFEGL